MNIEVVCFGGMREYLPPGGDSHSATVALEDESTIADLVDVLGAPRRLVKSALVEGRRAGLETVLQDGMQVTLMPPFTGGVGGIPLHGPVIERRHQEEDG